MNRLTILLTMIEADDTNYAARYGLVLQAVAEAHAQGLQAGFRIDPAEPAWPVAFIELPTGQVSWHMPQHAREWDGHSTEEKYKRCRAYVSADKIPIKIHEGYRRPECPYNYCDNPPACQARGFCHWGVQSHGG